MVLGELYYSEGPSCKIEETYLLRALAVGCLAVAHRRWAP